jgi:hypothetical protein
MITLQSYGLLFRKTMTLASNNFNHKFSLAFFQPAFAILGQAKESLLFIKNSPNYHGRLGETGDDLKQRIKEQSKQPEKSIVDRVND